MYMNTIFHMYREEKIIILIIIISIMSVIYRKFCVIFERVYEKVMVDL